MTLIVAPPLGSSATEPRPLAGVCHELPSICQGPSLQGTGVSQGTQHQDHGVTDQVREVCVCLCMCGGSSMFGNTVCASVPIPTVSSAVPIPNLPVPVPASTTSSNSQMLQVECWSTPSSGTKRTCVCRRSGTSHCMIGTRQTLPMRRNSI